MRATLLLALAASGAACISHANLAPPPVDASGAERLAIYQQLAPRGFGSFQNRRSNDIGFLVLGDGTRVYFPEDLAPVVPPRSPTAIAGERHRGAWARAKHWMAVGGVALAAAIVVPVVALATMDDGDRRTGIVIGGAAGGFVVGMGSFIAGAVDLIDANGERASAFLTYDDALRAELRLCVTGLEVYDCATGPASARASIPGVTAPPP